MAARTKPSPAKPVSKTKPAAKALAKRTKPPTAKKKLAPTAKKKLSPTAKKKLSPTAKKKPTARAEPTKQSVSGTRATGARPKTVAAAPRPKKRPPSPAREAIETRAMKKAIAEVFTPTASGSAVVDAYLREVDHPFKAEMEAVRAIILGVSPKIAERIKWNAPSFYYKEDLGAFNPRANEFAHLILLFPGGAGIPAKGTLLEGKHKDRREAKFHSLADVEAKKPALEKLIRSWLKLRDL